MNCEKFRYQVIYSDCCGDSIIVPVTCGRRSCSFCSSIDSRRVLSRYRSFISSFENVPVTQFALITLTTLSTSSGRLSDTYKLAKKSLSKLFRRKIWRDCVSGGFYCFETSTRSDGSFHLHIHLLVRVTSGTKIYPYKVSDSKFSASLGLLTAQRLASIWSGYTGAYIVDITPCTGDLNSVVSYLTKYLVKVPMFCSDSQRNEYDETFFATRRLSFFGLWYSESFLSSSDNKCKRCGIGSYSVLGEFIDYISSSSRNDLRKRGLLLDSYG